MNFAGIDDAVPEDVGRHILSFLDVPTLVHKKVVCRSWQLLFTATINAKAPTPQAFQSSKELLEAVEKYAKYNIVDADEFAETYGWPIGRWDVSNIRYFNCIFYYADASFNENIGSWDVSSATNTALMFFGAHSFHQDLSSWNTSNVKDMEGMFQNATSFNKDISRWNTSNVEDMSGMFQNATSFNQDISGWDTSSVECMSDIFRNATSFNQDISGWDTSNVNYGNIP
jgi:surface protein